MAKCSPIRKLVACLLIALIVSGPVVFAQEGPAPMSRKPVMENVFFNVVWGSLFGIVLGAAAAVIESDDKTAPEGIRKQVFGGATAGGIIGLGIGLWVVASGITFEPEGTLLFSSRDPDGFARPVASRAPPFSLQTSADGDFRVTGFRATVLDIRF
jgi:hypothetical protein